MTTKTGLFFHTSDVPCWTASSAMGLPAAMPKAMHALMIPANVATHTPRPKSNS
jgi:hypothetical protein